MEEIKRLKKELRKKVRDERKTLTPQQRSIWDEKIKQNLFSMDAFKNAQSVFCYISYGQEPDTMGILSGILQAEKKLYVPKIRGDGVMSLIGVPSLFGMVPGWNGILEPEDETDVATPGEIDFAILPALACTREGIRLGQGGGYYDRFLAKYSGPMAVLLHSVFLLSAIPHDALDMAVAAIVTEREVIATHQARK